MNRIEHGKGGTSFVGERAVNVFAHLVVASALEMYAKTGIKANRMYTPKNMLVYVERETGKKFKRTQMLEAALYLRDKAKAVRATVEEVTTNDDGEEVS